MLALLLACVSRPMLSGTWMNHDIDLLVRAATHLGEPPSTLAIADGRLVAGSEEGAPVIEADLVTPGMVDAHCHPIGLGDKLAELDLDGTTSLAEVLQRLGGTSGSTVQEARTTATLGAPHGDWLVGRGWDHNDWTDHDGWPTAADLDGVVADRPVMLRRIDGHAAWVNSRALQAAGIDAATPDPAGGRILRDASGQPTGVLVDNAMDLLPVPQPSRAEQERRLGLALAAIAAAGLTGVHDMGVDDDLLAIYTDLARTGRLPVEVVAWLAPGGAGAERLLRDGPWQEGRLSVVGLKVYADGALGSRGALLLDDYADEPGQRGLALSSEDELATLTERALGAGAQVAVHAIGDGAARMALDAFARARAAVPAANGTLLRLEHAQIVADEDLARLADLGVVASVEPTHATSDMPWAEERLGPDRLRTAYRLRDYLDAGVVLALGSDFPIEDVSPSDGLWAATTRTNLNGEPDGGWKADQALTLDEAIAGFSAGARRAAGQAPITLDPGQPATLTAWRVEQRLGHPWLTAVATVVDGEVTWTEELVTH